MAPVKTYGWFDSDVEQYERDPEFVAERMAIQLVEEALKLMEHEGTSRAELARRMQVKPAYVSRILNAPPNMTLRTIAELAIALNTRPHVSLHPKRPVDEGLTVLSQPS